MRVAALYDVHGNLPALTAVLAEVDALAVDETARRWVAARLGEERLAFLAALPVDLTGRLSPTRSSCAERSTTSSARRRRSSPRATRARARACRISRPTRSARTA